MKIKIFLLIASSLIITSCAIFSTTEEKITKCEAKGISRDTCYKVEMDNQRENRDRLYQYNTEYEKKSKH